MWYVAHTFQTLLQLLAVKISMVVLAPYQVRRTFPTFKKYVSPSSSNFTLPSNLRFMFINFDTHRGGVAWGTEYVCVYLILDYDTTLVAALIPALLLLLAAGCWLGCLLLPAACCLLRAACCLLPDA
jgi:hypothetical protein